MIKKILTTLIILFSFINIAFAQELNFTKNEAYASSMCSFYSIDDFKKILESPLYKKPIGGFLDGNEYTFDIKYKTTFFTVINQSNPKDEFIGEITLDSSNYQLELDYIGDVKPYDFYLDPEDYAEDETGDGMYYANMGATIRLMKATLVNKNTSHKSYGYIGYHCWP